MHFFSWEFFLKKKVSRNVVVFFLEKASEQEFSCFVGKEIKSEQESFLESELLCRKFAISIQRPAEA